MTPSSLLALKIDVDTLRGTQEGVPRLVECLQRYGIDGTFLFSLGPDQTGRAIRRVFRPGFLDKVGRTSVLEHYGLKTLLYGTFLPSPDIGEKEKSLLQSVQAAGFEVGIHAWNHFLWQDFVTTSDENWTAGQLRRAVERFKQIFGDIPHTHGAAGWQMNAHAYRLLSRFFDYCSDTRGSTPFFPIVEGETLTCPQVPTTLPTLDELIGINDLTPENVHTHLLNLTQTPPPYGHVYTLHAELEGMKWMPIFERLIEGWQAQGYTLCSMKTLVRHLDLATLPAYPVEMGTLAGRSGTVAMPIQP